MRKPPRFLLFSLLAEGLVPPPFFFPPPRIKTAIAAALPPRRTQEPPFPPRRSTHIKTAIAAPPQHAHKPPFRLQTAAPADLRINRSAALAFSAKSAVPLPSGAVFLKFTLQISSLCCTPCNLRRFGLYFGHRMRKGAGARRPGAAALPSAGRKYNHKECRQ